MFRLLCAAALAGCVPATVVAPPAAAPLGQVTIAPEPVGAATPPPEEPPLDENTLLDGDPHQRFSLRASVEHNERAALGYDLPFAANQAPAVANDPAFEVVVIDQRKDRVRVLDDRFEVAVVVVVAIGDLGVRVNRRTLLAPEPGGAMPPGVEIELAGGAQVTEKDRRGSWRRVAYDELGVAATGWLEAGRLGRIYRADTFPTTELESDREVSSPIALTAPSGAELARLTPTQWGLGEVVRAAGAPAGGLEPLEVLTAHARVRGWVAPGAATPKEPTRLGLGAWGGPMSVSSHTEYLQLPVGTLLLRDPKGPPFGRVLRERPLTFAIAGEVEDGHLRVAYVSAWGRLHGYVRCTALEPTPELPYDHRCRPD